MDRSQKVTLPSRYEVFLAHLCVLGVLAVGVSAGAAEYPRGIDPARTSSDPTWGYVRENPIRLGGPRGLSAEESARLYFDHLRDSNFLALRHRRAGRAGCGSDWHVVELFVLTGADGRKYRLYVDARHPETNPLDLDAPAGLLVQAGGPAHAPAAAGSALIARLPRAEEPMREAEAEYRTALRLWRELGGEARRAVVRGRHLRYLDLSRRYLAAMIDYARGLRARTEVREAYSRGAAGAIASWLAAQEERGYDPLPPDVRVWALCQLGLARAAAGEVAAAVRDGFDPALAVGLEGVAGDQVRRRARELRLSAAYFRARALTESAAGGQDWERALAATRRDLLDRPEVAGTSLEARARLLRIRCLVALGREEPAAAEYARARRVLENLSGEEAGAPARRLGAELVEELGPARAPPEHVAELLPAEVAVRLGELLERRGRAERAVGVWRSVARSGEGLAFAERCSPEGEPRARLLLGLARLRAGDRSGALLAWEAALVAFWERMPETFRRDPDNAWTIATLREGVLAECARRGLSEAAREPEDGALLRKWLSWKLRLKTGSDPVSPPDS
jgi:hypothetical protein